MKRHLILLSACSAIISVYAVNAKACTTILVGKDATKDKSIMIARNEDGKTSWPKRFIVNQPEKAHKYISKGNGFSIELPDGALTYTSTPDPDSSEGIYGESGVNSANVAMTESTDINRKALKYDDMEKKGISEDSMLDVVLPYIKSAKEGVQRLGEITEKYGAAEGDGVVFADNNEAWYFEVGSGHHWAAQRVPDNKYAVIPNQSMLDEIDTTNTNDYSSSKGIVDFIKKHHLSNTGEDGIINFYKSFGTNGKINKQYDGARQWDGQRLLTPSKKQKIGKTRYSLWVTPDKKIDIEDVQRVLSSHFDETQYDTYGKWEKHYRPIGNPSTIESHIFQMRPDIKTKNGTLEWLAMASPETSSYIPFYVNGISKTPDEYQKIDMKGTTGGAYWNYQLTRVLTQKQHNKLVSKFVKPAQNKLYNQYIKNIEDTDKKIASSKENPISTMEAANEKNSSIAINKFKEVNNDIIQNSDNNDKVSLVLKKMMNGNYAN